jgi:hypothetical protein
VADKNSIAQRALSNEMRFVFPGSEIDRGIIFCRDFAIDRHREGDGHERALALHRKKENAQRSTSNVQRPTSNGGKNEDVIGEQSTEISEWRKRSLIVES